MFPFFFLTLQKYKIKGGYDKSFFIQVGSLVLF